MANANSTRRRDEDVVIEPDQPHLEEFIGYNLKRAYMIVLADFRRALGDEGMAPRQFSALSLVVQFPNITQSGLARMLGIERSGLVALVDELEGRGFLGRTHVPGDRRVQALVATPAGRRACQEALDAVRAHEAQLLSVLSAEEKETLAALLKKIRSMEAE
jgi:DNA-binding MarR family transcriptional regulator